jgi:nucleotidyltransferase substrate binding protein (TIGR01987 family)
MKKQLPERARERLESLQKAYRQLSQALQRGKYDDLELAGLVQTFEFTIELAWKTMKDILESESYSPMSPKDTVRMGAKAGMIDDAVVWLDALDKRNQLSHTYDEWVAENAESLIRNNFDPIFSKFIEYVVEHYE